MLPLVVLAAAVVAAPAAVLAQPTTSVPTIAGQDANTFWDGTCENYDGVCNAVVNQGTTKRKIFVYTGANATKFEELVIFNILDAHDQAKTLPDVINDQCKIMTDAFVCASIYVGCDSTTFDEPVPVLPCKNFCDDTWNVCREAYNVYLKLSIGANNYMDSKLPNCGPNSTFSLTSLPIGTPKVMDADRFGSRLYPNHPIWPMGYKGQLKYPETAANYTTKAGVTKSVTCQQPGLPTGQLDVNYKPSTQGSTSGASVTSLATAAAAAGVVAAAMLAA